MNIVRPYEAEDNQINLAQRAVLEKYCKKIGETISDMDIRKYGVAIVTESGRKFVANISDQHMAFRNAAKFIYMKEQINGKQVRIAKENW